MALIAAIGKTRTRLSSTGVPSPAAESGSLPLESVPAQTVGQSAEPSDSNVDRIGFVRSPGEYEDVESLSEDHSTPVRVFENTQSQSYSPESKTYSRVSLLFPGNLSYIFE